MNNPRREFKITAWFDNDNDNTVDSNEPSRVVNVYVCKLDLQFQGLCEDEEEDPGAFLALNSNENDGLTEADGTPIPDNTTTSSQVPVPQEDPELEPLTIDFETVNIGDGTITLKIPPHLRVWKSARKDEFSADGSDCNSFTQASSVEGAITWDLSSSSSSFSFPMTVYVEGYSVGSGQLTATWDEFSGSADAVKTTVSETNIDVISVPKYVFANATYFIPIKWRIDDDQSYDASSLSAVNIFFKYFKHGETSETCKLLGDWKSKTVYLGNNNEFETYVNPAALRGINIDINHMADDAKFQVIVDLPNGITEMSQEEDDEAVVSMFSDTDVPIVEMANGNSDPSTTRTDLIASTPPYKKWVVSDWGMFDLQGYGTNMVTVLAGFGGFLKIAPESSRTSGTWEPNDIPRVVRLAPDATTIVDDNSLYLPSPQTTFDNSFPFLDAGSSVEMKNSGYDETLPGSAGGDFGTYTGLSHGARTAALVFVSYASRSVTLTDGTSINVMDTTRQAGTIEMQMAENFSLVTSDYISTPTYATFTYGDAALSVLSKVPDVVGLFYSEAGNWLKAIFMVAKENYEPSYEFSDEKQGSQAATRMWTSTKWVDIPPETNTYGNYGVSGISGRIINLDTAASFGSYPKIKADCQLRENTECVVGHLYGFLIESYCSARLPAERVQSGTADVALAWARAQLSTAQWASGTPNTVKLRAYSN